MKKFVTALLFISSTCFAGTSYYEFAAPKNSKDLNFELIKVPKLKGENQMIDIIVKSGRSSYEGTFYCMHAKPNSYRCQGDDDGGDFSIVLGKEKPILILKYINVGEVDRPSVHISSKVPLTIEGK